MRRDSWQLYPASFYLEKCHRKNDTFEKWVYLLMQDTFQGVGFVTPSWRPWRCSITFQEISSFVWNQWRLLFSADKIRRCLHQSLVTVSRAIETIRNPFIFCTTVLDSSIGKPAPGIGVRLEIHQASATAGGSETWGPLAKGWDTSINSTLRTV